MTAHCYKCKSDKEMELYYLGTAAQYRCAECKQANFEAMSREKAMLDDKTKKRIKWTKIEMKIQDLEAERQRTFGIKEEAALRVKIENLRRDQALTEE